MFKNFITKLCRRLMSGGNCHESGGSSGGCH